MAEPIRILIVEDLPTDAELAEREIRKSLDHCEFHRVETREDFLAALVEFHPDLIVSDYSMPRFDGLTALKLALEHVPSTPLIILTGSMNEDTAVGCMKAGAADYVIKEYIKRLGQAVVHALEEKQVRLERRRAEQALKESEERFRSLYENAMIGIYRTTPDGRILLANPAAVRLLGYDSFEDLAQRNLEKDGYDPSYSRREFRERLERDAVITGLEAAWNRRDGSTVYVRECARVIQDENGKSLYYDGTFEDITAWKQMEQTLLLTQFSVDRASIGIMRTDKEARIASANDQCCRMLGYTAEELGRLHVYDIDPTFPLERWKAHRQTLRRAGSDSFETTHRRKDGSTFPVEITNSYIEFQGNEFSVSFIQDISQRKGAEEALRIKDSAVESSLSAIGLAGLDGNLFYINEAFRRLWKCDRRDEILGRPLTEFVAFPQGSGNERNSVRGPNGYISEDKARCQDGTTIDIQISVSVVTDQAGGPICLMISCLDITERKLAERALRESEEMYRSMFNTSPTAIVVADLRERVVMVNQPALGTFGYTEDTGVLGRSIYDWVPPEEVDSLRRTIDALMGKGMLIQGNHTLLRQTGARFAAEINAAVVNNAINQPQYLMFMITDITERLQAEQSLRESEARYRTRTKELEALFTLSTRVGEAKTAEDVFPAVLRELSRALDVDACEVKLPDPGGEYLVITLSEGSVAAKTGKSFGRDEGMAGIVMQTGQPYVTDDYSADPHRMPDLPYVDIVGPAMAVPLISENEVLGVLNASRRKGPTVQPFSQEEVRLVAAMGEIAGNAVRRVRLFDEAQRRLRHTQALHDIQLSVASSFDLRITLNIALEHTLTQLGADAAAVFLFDPHTLTLEYAAGSGFRAPALKRNRLRLGEGPTGRAVLERKVVHIPDLGETSKEFLRARSIAEERFVTYCAVPFISKGQVKGVLEVFHRTAFHLDSEWQALLETLAGQIAIAVDNLMLFSDLQDSNLQLALAYDATIEGLSRALDLRDKETEDHTRRVTEMTIQLARALGMDEAEFIHLRRGALLHDIGKLGIPDAILFKPGPLTDTEWTIMRRHPEFAFEIFSPIEYLRPALDIPYCHHEKWDGTGYPRKLKGEAIPLAARLFAVVDVWDALTSERPYRQPWPQEQALNFIREQAGKHFDPNVVDVFMKISPS